MQKQAAITNIKVIPPSLSEVYRACGHCGHRDSVIDAGIDAIRCKFCEATGPRGYGLTAAQKAHDIKLRYNTRVPDVKGSMWRLANDLKAGKLPPEIEPGVRYVLQRLGEERCAL